METVERLAADGKLEQRMRPQPGGAPRAVYDPEDVEREAVERAAAAEAGKPYVMPFDVDARVATESDPPLQPGIAKAFAEAAVFARAPSANPSDNLFTPTEAALYAKRSVVALRKLQLQGKLPNAGTPLRILYRRADLDQL